MIRKMVCHRGAFSMSTSGTGRDMGERARELAMPAHRLFWIRTVLLRAVCPMQAVPFPWFAEEQESGMHGASPLPRALTMTQMRKNVDAFLSSKLSVWILGLGRGRLACGLENPLRSEQVSAVRFSLCVCDRVCTLPFRLGCM